METTEDETDDEDFYDEHPQKLANQIFNEKRQQTQHSVAASLLQTQLNPVNGKSPILALLFRKCEATLLISTHFDIYNALGMPFMNTTSRPATPTLLPGEVEQQKAGRIKKRRRNHKMRSPDKMSRVPLNKSMLTPFSDQRSAMSQQHRQFHHQPHHQASAALHANIPAAHTIPMSQASAISIPAMGPHDAMLPTTSAASVAMQPTVQSRIMGDPSHLRLNSTSSCSDADSSLKRSKRRRIPNKFYGYTSDEDSISAASALNSFQNPFKPTPPPNLTWSKEDLPKPSKNRASSLKNLMRLNASGKVTKQRKAPINKGMVKQTTIRKNHSSVSACFIYLCCSCQPSMDIWMTFLAN